MQAPRFLFKTPPWRLFAATCTVALAGVLAQSAVASPFGHGGPGGPGGGPGAMGAPGLLMAPPHHVDRLLDSVNASAEQRTQIRQILQVARDDLKPLHEAGRKLHEQAQALFAQPAIDAAAAEALRQKLLAQHDQASKRMLQAMLDVSRVLTPEQRKALADRASQRRAMFERHRAEREAIDAPPKR
jgi:Spy/CpxP family protein refolding chaperone